MSAPVPPNRMHDDALCSELMETVLRAKSFGTWDRSRLRAVCKELHARGLLTPEGSISSEPRVRLGACS